MSVLNRNLMLLLIGRLVSDLGSNIQLVVMPLYILDMGGTAATIGLFSFIYMLPILLIVPFGGVIGDRLNRKMIMVITDLSSGIVLFIMAYLSYKNMINIEMLLLFQVIVSLLHGLFDPATKGIVPSLVEKKDLAIANSTTASLRIMAGILSPLMGVGLYTAFGINLLFVINACSFILSGISELFIHYEHEKGRFELTGKLVLQDLGHGFKFIRNHEIIFSLCSFFFLAYALIHPLFSVLLPLYFRQNLNYSDAYYGYLQVILFLGAFLGSIIVGYLSKKRDGIRLVTSGISVMSIGVFMFSLILHPRLVVHLGNDSLAYFIIFATVTMLSYGGLMFSSIPMQTLIQNGTPDDYMSRVFSIVSLISKGGAPLGALIYGIIIGFVNLHVSALVIASLVVLLSFKYNLRFMQLNR